MSDETNNELVSVREAASECGRNMETIRRWIWGGKLPAQKLGNQLFIKKSDLASFCRETAVIKYKAEPKSDFLERARALREEIHKRTGTTFDAGEEIRQMREERDNELMRHLNELETGAKPGSKADLIKRMRKLRESIRARVGNLDAVETIEQLRKERMNELTRLR